MIVASAVIFVLLNHSLCVDRPDAASDFDNKTVININVTYMPNCIFPKPGERGYSRGDFVFGTFADMSITFPSSHPTKAVELRSVPDNADTALKL